MVSIRVSTALAEGVAIAATCLRASWVCSAVSPRGESMANEKTKGASRAARPVADEKSRGPHSSMAAKSAARSAQASDG